MRTLKRILEEQKEYHNIKLEIQFKIRQARSKDEEIEGSPEARVYRIMANRLYLGYKERHPTQYRRIGRLKVILEEGL